MTVSHSRSKLSLLIWLLLISMIIAAGAFLFTGRHPSVYYLSFYEGHSEEILFQQQVEMGETLVLNYIHSADATPISVIFEIRADGMHLIEEKYSWYGAGLEAGSGHQFVFEGKDVTVSGYDRVFEELPLRVARSVPQEMVLGGKIIILNQLAPGGTLLIIRVDQK